MMWCHSSTCVRPTQLLRVATPLLLSHRGYASGHAGSNAGGGASASTDYYNRGREGEEDKALEEEELSVLHERREEDYMPVAHRLAHKADALDSELRRLRYELWERPQLLVDTTAATFSGRPTRMAKVLELLSRKRPAPDAEAMQSVRNAGSTPPRSPHALPAKMETALRDSPFAAWRGTSSPVLRLLHRVLRRPGQILLDDSSAGKAALTTLDADLDHLRRARAMHQLNYYSRISLIPKRHIGHAVYMILWNLVVAVQDACGCVVYGVLRGVKDHGVLTGVWRGGSSGIFSALQFLGYGWVISPALHLSRGLCNSLYGPINAYTARYTFDALSGRWMQCTVADARLFRRELQLEKRVLRVVGRAEFRRKRIKSESKWAQRAAAMGFSVDMLKDRFMPGGSGGGGGADRKDGDKVMNPYEVLKLRRTASAQEIKKQYKKLAMVFHPDVAQSRQDRKLTEAEAAETQRKFEEISGAYQVLSNPEKRRAYDVGGAQGLRVHESKFGTFMSRTADEMVQNIFGGEGFRRLLLGELLRSHWALRNESQISVSLIELEQLQNIRIRQMAMELAAMADVHARRPTTPYHGGSNSNHALHDASVTNSIRRSTGGHGASSSLPDYLKSGKTRSRGFSVVGGAGSVSRQGSGTAAAGGSHGIGKEMHNSIMEELGEGSAQFTSSHIHAGGSGGFHGKTSHGEAHTVAASARESSTAAAASPYVLHSGSNAYNCFSKDFEDRCDRLIHHLTGACFGKQLLYEVGEAYVTNATRFLGVRPFYAPKLLVTRKIFTGMDRVKAAFQDKAKPTPQQVGQKIMAEYFNLEYDAVVADAHVALRFAIQMVLQDQIETDEVRKKRCYAVWLIGEKMMAAGEKWTSRIATDEDLVAYLQQAATSSATTSTPPAF